MNLRDTTLGQFLHPAFNGATIFGQLELPHAHPFADQSVRFRIARHAGDPLLADIELLGGEPALRQDFHQPGLRVENE